MVRICVSLVLLLVFVAISSQYIIDKKQNGTNKIEEPASKNTRRKNKKSISTSSSQMRASGSSSRAGDETLGISDDTSTSEQDGKRDKYFPVSSEERKGWRKWHRKCTPCPDDRAKKWRDPSIKWICGAYQQARRSFKSLCMMHHRNCQDGTMFVKVYDHRCANDTASLRAHGDSFFYTYRVQLTDEDTEELSEDKNEFEYSDETRELVVSSDS